jgi:hypothetical protein
MRKRRSTHCPCCKQVFINLLEVAIGACEGLFGCAVAVFKIYETVDYLTNSGC